MIIVFFNEYGYSIAGDGIEVSQRCSPALTTRGDRIFQPTHHTYKVLYNALCELKNMDVKADVMVYNDSRIIDEINGTVEPLDSTCDEWLKSIKRNIIPSIMSIIFFRKRPTVQVDDAIALSHSHMVSEEEKRKIAKKEENTVEKRIQDRNGRIVSKLKQSWFGDITNG
jgi:hypothetical protein